MIEFCRDGHSTPRLSEFSGDPRFAKTIVASLPFTTRYASNRAFRPIGDSGDSGVQ
jgi:hypothetical protein